MIPLVIQRQFVNGMHLMILQSVKQVVERLPDGIDCHTVCHEIENRLCDVRHVRGEFNGYDHSWLEIRDTRLIIDAYPWACASGPILLDCQTGSPWTLLYQARK